MDFSMIFELFVNLFQGIVFVTFCYKFLTPSKSKRVNLLAYLIAFILMFFSITLINWLYLSFAYIETVVFFVIMIPYCILFFKDKIYIKLIIPVFLNVFYSVLSFGINYFFSAIIDCDYNYLMTENSVYRYIYIVLSNLIFVIALVVVYNLFKNSYHIFRAKEIIITLIIPILSVVIGLLTFRVSSNSELSSVDRIILGVISITILSFTFINFYLIKSISKNYMLNNENIVLNKEKDLYRMQIKSNEMYMHSVSAIKHNIKNQLLCIENLIDERRYDEAREICLCVENDISARVHFYKTGNVYLDAILNIVKEKALENDIELIVSCKANLKFISGDELAVIIGNLADNAIEALAKEQNKKLKIEIMQKGVYEILSVQNFSSHSVLKNNPKLITNKKNRRNHGYGLNSVRNTVNKYGGDMTCCEQDNYFFVNLMFEKPNTPK